MPRVIPGLLLIPALLLTGCGGSYYGRLCTDPDRSFPDGAWERVVFVNLRTRWALAWTYKTELSVRVETRQGVVFDKAYRLAPGSRPDLACAWDGPGAVVVSADAGQVLDLRVEKGQDAWHAVIRSAP